MTTSRNVNENSNAFQTSLSALVQFSFGVALPGLFCFTDKLRWSAHEIYPFKRKIGLIPPHSHGLSRSKLPIYSKVNVTTFLCCVRSTHGLPFTCDVPSASVQSKRPPFIAVSMEHIRAKWNQSDIVQIISPKWYVGLVLLHVSP